MAVTFNPLSDLTEQSTEKQERILTNHTIIIFKYIYSVALHLHCDTMYGRKDGCGILKQHSLFPCVVKAEGDHSHLWSFSMKYMYKLYNMVQCKHCSTLLISFLLENLQDDLQIFHCCSELHDCKN